MSISYSATTWVSGTTALSAANMNNIESGISNATTEVNLKVAKAGDTMTSALITQVTLSGSNKTVAEWKATDGKDYKLLLRTDGKLSLFNNTDSVSVAEWGPTAGTITANGATVWTSANDGASSGLDADSVDGVGATGFLQLSGVTGTKLYIQGTTPSSPAVGDIWIDTSVNLG